VHRAEPAGEGLVFLDVLLVLAQRGRADHPDLTAGEHRLEDVGGVGGCPQGRAGADHRMHLVHEEDEIGVFLDLADDVLDPVLEHATEHGAGNHAVHLEVDDLAVAQAHRDRLRLELDPPGQPLDDGGLAHAGLTDEHHGVGAFAVAENLHHLAQLFRAPVERRDLVLPRQLVQVGREVLQEGRQLELLPQPFLPLLEVTHPGGDPGHEQLRLDPVPPDDGHGNALALLEDGREEVGRLDGLPAGAARMVERQLEQELRRRRDARLAVREGRHQPQVLLQRLEDFVRVEVQVAHDLGKHVPFHLGERQEDVLVGQQPVLAAPGFLDRAVHHSLG